MYWSSEKDQRRKVRLRKGRLSERVEERIRECRLARQSYSGFFYGMCSCPVSEQIVSLANEQRQHVLRIGLVSLITTAM
jgi:hypothetical protein